MTRELLFGLWRDETFAVLDAAWARQADVELGRLKAVTTWAEAFEVARSMEVVAPPVHPDDDPTDYTDDPGESLTYDALPGVADGDYPTMPGQLTFRWLPEDLQAGGAELAVHREETMLNGDYLVIAPDQEAALVAALAARGFTTVRDDALVDRIGWFD